MDEKQTALLFICSEAEVASTIPPSATERSSDNLSFEKANNIGEVAEWSNAHRWKRCVPQGTAGSNPVLSATVIFNTD